MGLDFTAADIEGTALALYRRAGLEPDAPADPIDLAERLLGVGCVRYAHASDLPGVAALVRVGGSFRIYLRGRASAQRQAFGVLHELGHVAAGFDAPEQACDAIAAALWMPRPAFQRAAREHGADWASLARRFGATESAVSLRWGEAIGEPLVLVAPRTVRVRGEEYEWPPETLLRQLSRSELPGLARARLSDDSRRIVLRHITQTF
jgi:hypothetical protein